MRRLLALLSLSLILSPTLYADDGAASIAAGGIIVMKREPRIVMSKEVLQIGGSPGVIVDYDFRNDSDEDVTTEVAFPIPAYEFDGMSCCNYATRQGFDDFKLWVNQRPIQFTTETRAFVGNKEVTDLLKKLAVDAGSFGHYQDSIYMQRRMDGKSWDIERLTDAQRQRLIAVKAFDDGSPSWRVEKKYHWTQTFPAHAIIHIRHEYTPDMGNSSSIGDVSHYNPKNEENGELATFCPTPALLQSLKNTGYTDEDPTGLFYIDFILTTANTWKTPIEDFTLIVTRDTNPGYKVNYVSFCWDGPVTKLDASHFSAHLTNFTPKKELSIGYIQSDWTEKQKKANRKWNADHHIPQ